MSAADATAQRGAWCRQEKALFLATCHYLDRVYTSHTIGRLIMVRLMRSGIVALAAAFGSPLAAQVAPSPGSLLAEMPGTQIRYYEVTGANVTEINRSIARQRPTSTNGKTVPATTDWAIRAEFDRTETDGQCRVTAARAKFTASADLPRLAPDARLDKPTRDRWDTYVTELEQGSLVTLVFVTQNLPTIEKAMFASDCESARQVAAAAIDRLRAQTARLIAEREKRLARQNVVLAEFQPASLRAAKTDCRDLDVTGTRLTTVRACLPAREWERMQNDSEAFARGVQDTRSQREPF